MMLRKWGGASWLLVVATASMLTCTMSRLLAVGGAPGWTQGVNYTDWASHQHFYVRDWLIFRFDKRLYNVLEVNETNYEQCYDHGFIQNITKGGRDVYQLTEARPYYFLSSGGYCYNGMKLAIKVEASAPAPAPAKNTSPSKTSSQVVPAIVSAIAAWIWSHGL